VLTKDLRGVEPALGDKQWVCGSCAGVEDFD
jgi:hypothetical protein